MTTLYGIKNCDTIKKAKRWLEENNIEFTFHDFRKDGLDEKLLRQWMKNPGWQILLNKRGTTWRQLPEDVKNNINERSAFEIMKDNPAIIKRPVLMIDDECHVGFKETEYQDLFSIK